MVGNHWNNPVRVLRDKKVSKTIYYINIISTIANFFFNTVVKLGGKPKQNKTMGRQFQYFWVIVLLKNGPDNMVKNVPVYGSLFSYRTLLWKDSNIFVKFKRLFFDAWIGIYLFQVSKTFKTEKRDCHVIWC